MTGRACFAIEIDPAYVDVAILRWQAFTGEVARLCGAIHYGSSGNFRSAEAGKLVHPTRQIGVTNGLSDNRGTALRPRKGVKCALGNLKTRDTLSQLQIPKTPPDSVACNGERPISAAPARQAGGFVLSETIGQSICPAVGPNLWS